jgi:AcrR family transcriptional regulator
MGKQDKKESIINAALQCIGKRGVQDVTVREITEQASVNTASINYYFGSKERLINQALEQHFENLLIDWEVILERRAMDFSEGLKTLLQEIMDETHKNPNLIKAHLYEPLIYNRTEGPFADQFDRFLNHLLEEKKKSQPDKSEQTHQLEIMQLFSGILFPGLLADLFDDFDQWDLQNVQHQKLYVEQLVSRVIAAN